MAAGWQVVPKVPTQAMRESGSGLLGNLDVGTEKEAAHKYANMLQAAPTPEDRDDD